MKMMRVHITLWVVLLIIGFLLGFVPEYLKNRELQTQLENPKKTIDTLKLQLQLGDVRDAAALMLLELSRQNYGLARDHSMDYYNKLHNLINESQDENLKKSLAELSATQNSLTTNLLTSTPNSLAAAQPNVSRTFEVTKNVNKSNINCGEPLRHLCKPVRKVLPSAATPMDSTANAIATLL